MYVTRHLNFKGQRMQCCHAFELSNIGKKNGNIAEQKNNVTLLNTKCVNEKFTSFTLNILFLIKYFILL